MKTRIKAVSDQNTFSGKETMFCTFKETTFSSLQWKKLLSARDCLTDYHTFLEHCYRIGYWPGFLCLIFILKSCSFLPGSLPSICSCMSRIVPHSINERVTSQMVSWQQRRRCWRCYSTQGFSFKIAWWRMVETHKAFWVFGPEVIWWQQNSKALF